MSYWNKIKKLRRMPRDEVRCRIAKVFNRRNERTRWRNRTASPVLHQNGTTSDQLLDRCVRLVPGANLEQIKNLSSRYNSLSETFQTRLRERSASIIHGKWRLLGHAFDLTGNVPWHTDPRTKYQWERTFYADLPLYDLEGETDIKYPWELSRHQFLPELSRNYLLNGCNDSACRTRDLILDWIDENPIYEGVNWTSGLEVAMRAISWIWALAGLSSWTGWRDGDLAKISSSLWDHAVYLRDNFSHYSSPYNHLIGEAAGLLCIANLFDEDKLTRQWKTQARTTLLKSGPEQFYDDHFCVEQAVGYHYYTLGFLVIAWQAARAFEQPLDELTSVIHAGFQTGAAFRRPDGTWPAIGDLDSARAIPVQADNYWSFDSLNNLAAVLFDDPTLKTGDNGPGEELYWLTGADGLSHWDQMKSDVQRSTLQQFPDAGYVIASDGQDWLLFDAGPVSHGLFEDATPSTAHGHADTLQVMYCCDGESVLDDGGMPFYGGDQDWVTYFRSPAAHNVVKIDGADFVRRAGRLAWSHHVKRPTLNANLKDSTWQCSGKLTWPDVSHERNVLCLPGQGLWIADLITSNRPRNATWFWQLPADSIELSESMLANWDAMNLTCASSNSSGQLILDSATGSQPEGWRCFGYGEKQPGSRISLTQEIQTKVLVLTSIGRVGRPSMNVEIGGIRLAEANQNARNLVNIGTLSDCQWFTDGKHMSDGGARK